MAVGALLVFLVLLCCSSFPIVEALTYSHRLASTKAYLARKLFLKEDPGPLNLDWHLKWKTIAEGDIKNGIIFRNSDTHYIYADQSLAKLDVHSAGIPENRSYSLQKLQKSTLPGSSYVTQKMEQGAITYFAVCYEALYCDILTTGADMDFKRLQTISIQQMPVKLHFFLHRDSLYLAMVADYTTIYRWMETYFNEEELLSTKGAQDVDSFNSEGSTIIVFAQNNMYSKGDQLSSVFVKKDKNFQLKQLLTVADPIKVKYYQVPTRENGPQHFFLFLSRSSENLAFWWNFKDLSIWGTIPPMENQKSVFYDYIGAVPLVFITGENQISLFEATLQGLSFLKAVSSDGEVVQMVTMGDSLIILSERFQSSYEVSIVEMSISRTTGASQRKHTVRECMASLEASLAEKRKFIENAKNKVESTFKNKPQEAKISGTTVFNDLKVKKLRVNPSGKPLTTTPTNIKKKLKENYKKLETLKEKLKTGNIKKNRYLVKGDVFVKHLEVNSVTVDSLNQRPLEMDSFLSVTKDQNLDGELFVQQLKVDDLEAIEINSHSPDDMLQKNLATQHIKGEKAIGGIVANNVEFKEGSTVNGVRFSSYATTFGDKPVVIKGTKRVQHVAAKELNVKTVNKDSFEEWFKKMQPDWKKANQNELISYHNLTVGDLQVETINNISWSDIMKNIENAKDKPGLKKLKNLEVSSINGIPFDSFLTKSTAQNISSDITVQSMESKKVEFNTLNNLTRVQVADLVTKIIFSGIASENENASNTGQGFFHQEDAINGTIQKRSEDPEFAKFSDIIRAEHSSRTCRQNTLKGRKNVIINGDVYVEGSVQVEEINHVNFKKTLSKMIFLSQKNATINMTFTNVTVDSIKADKIEDWHALKPQNRKLIVNGSLTIPALKWSQNIETAELRIKKPHNYDNISISGNIQSNLLNGIDLVRFAETRLSKTKDQVISAAYNVETVYTTNLKAEDINGIKLDNILYANNGNITVSSDVIFKNLGVKGNITMQPWNQCNLKKLADMDVSTVKHFDTLEILKNISWHKNLRNAKRLSYLMKNAVMKNKVNCIKAPVEFKNNVTVTYMDAKDNVNAVNLSFILEDAIFSSKRKQKIKTEVFLKSPVTVSTADFKSNVVVDTVDGVSIEKFNDDLYRLDDDIVVTGLKTFKKGFKAFSLKAGLIHGVKTENFVTIADFLEPGENHTFPQLTFEKLHVLNNMTVGEVNGVNVSELLNKRISISKDEIINEDLHVKGNVKILDTIEASTINGVNLNETFSIYDDEIVLEGPLNIENLEFFVNGNVNVKSVNDASLREKFENTIMKDENTTLLGNVVFEKGLTVKGNTDVGLINGCQIENIYDKISTFVPRYTAQSFENISKISKMSSQLSPDVILQYLEHNSSLQINLVNVKETTVLQSDKDLVDIHIYGMTDENCGLPEKCLCPRHLTVAVNGSSLDVIKHENNVRQFYYKSLSLDVAIDVETSTISYSNRCHLKGGQDEVTTLRWMKLESNTSGEITLVDGYLSDVKFFKLGNSVYTILAFYYNGNISESRNLNVTVYELRVDKVILNKIDSIPAKGAVSVDLIWAQPGYFLVIGNTKSDDPASDTVYTEVYRFDERTNKFQGLRKIGSHGVLDLKAIRIRKEAFIFIVQKKPWPLLAFKYSKEYDNFYFFEKFHSRHGFLSVNTVANSANNPEDVYVGMVVANNEFKILKFKHIEGFVEMLSVKQEDVISLESFSASGTNFVLAISPTPAASRLLRIVNSP